MSRRWKVSGDSMGSGLFASLDSHSIGSCMGWAHEGEEAGLWLSGRLPLAEHIGRLPLVVLRRVLLSPDDVLMSHHEGNDEHALRDTFI